MYAAMYAAVQIRGYIGVRQEVVDTLFMLKMRKKHAAILVDEKNKATMGMLDKAKDVITYGPISDAVAKKLQEKMKDGVAHLQPPKGGFERKGIKVAYTVGGALGKRDTMDAIVEKML
jgi:large subunit ribosomal protein L30